jgi:hypothetical protein
LEGIDAQRMAKLIPTGLPPPQLYLTTARHAKLWAFMVDNGLIGPTGLMDLRNLAPPSSTPKAEFERFSRPGANVINKLALQRQFFCSGTT